MTIMAYKILTKQADIGKGFHNDPFEIGEM